MNNAINNATNLAFAQGPPLNQGNHGNPGNPRNHGNLPLITNTTDNLNQRNLLIFEQMQERVSSLEAENRLLKNELTRKNVNNRMADENLQLKTQLQVALRKIQKSEGQKARIRESLKHVKL